MSNPDPLPAPADPAPVFAALGDRTRLILLSRLSDGKRRSISALAADSRMTRQAVTKHLKVLEQAGLVTSSRSGRESRYSFDPKPIAGLKAYLDQVSLQWDGALARLQAFVEDEGSGSA
ncbi:ArsR family transcriptional regulator [Hoeflea marina]|uniref:ArsR family transcriptional regulator n=1 Tax=Hoeflea marina TaxID=274592 RepID=A0A317PIB2_9HYPH|nr:metalloregulator ArsR/SmtB family transcription factor [Hoeflea marina]PWV98947.1 ArsR family transcriptional regulator [Hoeflea marina]